ncbi:MAG: DNA methyltransferase [Dehalococcoidia bacterium]
MPSQTREQLPLWEHYRADDPSKAELRDAAAAENKTKPIHRWVPWIAGYSAQFAADAIDAYLPSRQREQALVLDPFAGVATTLVETLKAGCNAIGYDINPFAVLAARAKINCVDVALEPFRAEVDEFRESVLQFESEVDGCYAVGGTEAMRRILGALPLAAPIHFASRIPFFSPPVEAKFLYAFSETVRLPEPRQSLFRAALGATMVSYSNYSYEPSLSSRPGAGKPLIDNASVAFAVCRKLEEMLQDIEWAQGTFGTTWRERKREIAHSSYFASELAPQSVALVVTSPPYMNNYHYVRNTRAQLHWLELITGRDQLKPLERENFGKFWQTVRQCPRIELSFDFPELVRAIGYLRGLNTEKGYYGGSGWANYVTSYFNDSYRFLGLIKRQLKPGAHAVIVVGNSIIQGMEFKVDHLLAQVAEQHELYVDDIRIVRIKRVGNSIINSSVRNGDGNGDRQRPQLYDAAVVLRA